MIFRDLIFLKTFKIDACFPGICRKFTLIPSSRYYLLIPVCYPHLNDGIWEDRDRVHLLRHYHGAGSLWTLVRGYEVNRGFTDESRTLKR